MLENLRNLSPLLAPYRKRIIVAFVLGAIGGLGTGAGFTAGARKLFGLLFTDERDMATSDIVLVASVIPMLALLVGVCLFLSSYHLNYAGLAAIRELRLSIFKKLQELPIAYFHRNKSGDLLVRITADTQVMQQSLNLAARDVVREPMTFFGAIVYLCYLSVQNEGFAFVLISIAALPVVIFPIRKLGTRLRKKAHQQQEELSDVTNDITQNLSGVREVRAFNLEDREIERFTRRIGELFRKQLKVVKYTFSLSPSVEFITSFGLATAVVVGYKAGLSGGDFIALFVALYFSYNPVKRIGRLSGELQKGGTSLDRIRAILDEPTGIEDPKSPAKLGDAIRRIEFKDVSFAYDENAALQDANVEINEGDICALVGPSGAGKSTFASLVPRFYDVSSGAIEINGIDIRNFDQKDLRDQIAIVSQEPMLFDDTILENIRLGRLDASDADVENAARQAFAHDFITDPHDCPDGYQTLVGERGARLSGGQKQRIAIARAFLRNAPILILDEATSALDSESERMVQQALEKLVSGKTVLVIAHRFSTIRNANKILVFQDGRIIDNGPHEALYERCLLYKSLYDQQRAS